MNHSRQVRLIDVFALVGLISVLCATGAAFGWGTAIVNLAVLCLWTYLLRTERLRRVNAGTALLSLVFAAAMIVCGTAWVRHGHLYYRDVVDLPGVDIGSSNVAIGGPISLRNDWEHGDLPVWYFEGAGFSFVCLPRTFNGSDYIARPFAGVVIPYWFVLSTGAIVLLRVWLGPILESVSHRHAAKDG